jgi:hypothetical protein
MDLLRTAEFASLLGVNLAGEKRVIEERLPSLNTTRVPGPGRLSHMCKGIADWLDWAGETERELALDALQVTVEATRDEATVSGVLPVVTPQFMVKKRSSRRSSSGEYRHRLSFPHLLSDSCPDP